MGSVEVEILASTYCTLSERVEDAEIFQVLEESRDSDVTIFSSEEDEDGNKPGSDEDGQLDDNSETKLHKSYENAIGKRNVQIWHYKDKKKKISQQNLGNQLPWNWIGASPGKCSVKI